MGAWPWGRRNALPEAEMLLPAHVDCAFAGMQSIGPYGWASRERMEMGLVAAANEPTGICGPRNKHGLAEGWGSAPQRGGS